jgi:xylulokinase
VADILKRSVAAAGIDPKILCVSGGGGRSAWWNQVKADITGLPVRQMAVPDAACLGAAMLAAVGVGAFDGPSDAAATMTHPVTTFEPQAAHMSAYGTLFSLWRALYPALRSVFSNLGQMHTQVDTSGKVVL